MAVPIPLSQAYQSSLTPKEQAAKAAAAPKAPPAPAPYGAPAPAASTTGGTASPQPTSLTAQADPRMTDVFQQARAGASTMDPFLKENVENLRGRMSTDVTERATQKASGRIADMGAGAAQAAKERAAAFGGGEEASQNRIQDAVMRAQAGAASDIALGQEQRLDALTLGGQDVFAAPGQRQLQSLSLAGGTAGQIAGAQQGQQSLQLQAQAAAAGQAQTAAALELQRQQAQAQLAQQQQQALMSQFSTLWGSGISPSSGTTRPSSTRPPGALGQEGARYTSTRTSYV